MWIGFKKTITCISSRYQKVQLQIILRLVMLKRNKGTIRSMIVKSNIFPINETYR